MAEIAAGFAASDITPPAGCRRPQWGGQSLVAMRAIRPLMARAAVFRSGADAVAVVSLDLCLLCVDITRRVEAMLRAVAPGVNFTLILNASHTHEAPVLLPPEQSPYELGYDQVLVERIGSAVARATRAAVPATLHLAQKQTVGLNRNRRRKDGPVDRTLSLVEARDRSGRLLAGLWHFAAHPLAAMNTRAAWDPDFPGVACERLEREHPGTQFQFLQGAAGDVFPLDWYLHQDPPSSPTSLETATRLGDTLAEQVASLLGRGASMSGDHSVRGVSRTIQLPTRRPNWTAEEADAAVKKYHAKLDHSIYEEWKQADHVNTIAQVYDDRYRWVCAIFAAKIARQAGTLLDCHLTAVRVGGLVFPAVPGELFSESGIQLRDYRPDAATLVLPYSNDNILYLPPTHDLDEVQNWPLEEFLDQKRNRWAYGSTATAFIGQGGAEAIVETHQRLIDSLFIEPSARAGASA